MKKSLDNFIRHQGPSGRKIEKKSQKEKYVPWHCLRCTRKGNNKFSQLCEKAPAFNEFKCPIK